MNTPSSSVQSVLTPGGGADDSDEPKGILPLLDQLLRQRDGFFDVIFEGRNLGSRLRSFLLIILVLSAFYGMTMGAIGLTQGVPRGLQQMLSSAVKVPLLFLASLAVCYPVLYIVLVLMGVRLGFAQTLSLIFMALSLNSLLLASCAPITLFFALTGANYDFVKLLHVVTFAFSASWAMMALWKGLQTMCEKSDLYPRQAIRILQVWVLVFGFVGTQVAWSLRPFVGSPGLEFQVLRMEQKGNFYEAVWSSVVALKKGNPDPGRNPPR
ncbi:MAG: actin-binding WH2 domain-containing protein [Verrucomicrobia bacterium]|nr:actin-binding WH2 domain-containing protein [Verrucomicrobiota bacterium]